MNEESKEYFKRIINPLKLISVSAMLGQHTKRKRLKFLLSFIERNNVNCYKLIGEINKQKCELLYVDLETPILLYPAAKEYLPLEKFLLFFEMTKRIKSNLNQVYSQESKAFFIQIKKTKENKEFYFVTFKLEDQNIPTKSLSQLIKEKEDRREKLTTFLEFEIKEDITDINENRIYLTNGKKRNPLGRINEKNRLNLLTGREWIKFTKSWYIHRPPPRKKDEILHPAKFPETMIRDYITFFTKSGELILDPFLGSGSTIIAAKQSNRNGVGIELSSFYADISKKRLKELEDLSYPPLYQTKEKGFWKIIQGNSKKITDIWSEYNFPEIDFCITSPPYWSQLERDSIRQKSRKELGLDTKYSENNLNDLGNIKDYEEFINEQKEIFNCVYGLLRSKGYLVIITNNVFAKGRVYPLAYDTATSLTRDKNHPWILKDEKVWLQDDKALIALGVNSAWVGNRCHQFCLIFRKEDNI